MSEVVENRVVSMRFDNAEFQAKSKETINSIKNLESNLKLDGATIGLDKIKTALSNFSLSKVVDGAAEAGSGFTNMSVVGISAISELTRRVVDLGLSITQNLGSKLFGPMMEGFGEYQTQMGAVQTVLTNTADKGTTLKDVNKAFSELNTYADKTIYNFAEMTRNIGTFTAAGVDLDKATTSIKGIANLAAGSGSSSQQASVAMYQLSQAIAAGTVKLQDWNSVVNAGMGGQLFQKELQKTAESYGVNVNKLIKENGSFRESLQEGWVTADILTETLSRFADESTDIGKRLTAAATEVKTVGELFDSIGESIGSGWASLWQIIIGDYDEAKIVLTDIFNTFDKVVGRMFDGVITTAESWKELGGRAKLIDTARVAFQKLSAIAATVKKALDSLIPPATGQTLFDLTNKIYDFVNGVSTSRVTMIQLSNILKGITSIFLIFKQAVSGIKSVFEPLKTLIDNAIMKLSEVGYFLNALRESNIVLRATNVIWAKLGGIMNGIVKAFEEVFPVVFHTVDATDTLKNIVIQLVAFVSRIINVVQEPIVTISKGLFSIYHIIFNIISSFVRAMSQAAFLATIIKWVGAIASKIASVFINIDETTSKSDTFFKIFSKIVEFLNGAVALMETIFKGAVSSIDSFFEAFKKSTGIDITGIFNNVVNALSNLFSTIANGLLNFDVGTAFDSLINKINDFTKKVNAAMSKYFPSKKIAKETNKIKDNAKQAEESVGPLEKILDIYFNILSKIKGAFSKIADGLRALGNIIGRIFKSITKNITAQNFESVAKGGFFILLDIILAKATFFKKSFSKDIGQLIGGDIFEKFKDALETIGDIGESVTKVMDQISNTLQTYQTKLKADALKSIAVSIAILAASMLILSLIDAEKLTASAVAMTELFAELVGSLALLVKATKATQTADIPTICLGMIELSAAVFIMALALKMISKLDPDGVKNGVIAIETLMLGMVLSMKNLSSIQGGIKSSTSGLIKLSASVLILAIAMKMLSSIDSESLNASLFATEALLGGLVLSAKVLSSLSGGMKRATSGMMKLAVSVVILAIAMKTVAKIDPEALGSSFLVITGLLAGLVIAAKLLASDTKKFSSATAGLILMAVSVNILAGALKKVASLPSDGVLNAALALSAMTLVVAYAMKILSDMGGKATSIVAAGVAMAAVINSLKAIASSIEVLAKLPTKAIGISVAALVIVLYMMLTLLKNIGKNVNVAASASIIVFGMSLENIASAIEILSKLPTKKLAVATAAVVILISVLSEAMGKIQKMATSAFDAAVISAAFLLYGEALKSIASSIEMIAQLDVSSIAVATIALVAIIGVLGLFTKSVNPGQMLSIAPALLTMSIALIAMSTALFIISNIGIMGAVIGIAAIIGLFGALAIGMRLIKPVIGTMYSFSGALIAMGIGLTLISTAIMIFVVAFTMLATAVSTVGVVAAENMKNLILSVLTIAEEVIMAKLSTWAVMVPLIIETLFTIFSQSVEKIIEPLLNMLLNILQALGKYIPQIVDALLDLLIAIFEVLITDEKTKTLIEDITVFLMQTLEGLLEGLTEEIPTLVHDLFEFIATFLESLHEELSTNGQRIAKAIADIIGDLIDMAITAIGELFTRLTQTGYNIGKKIGEGVSNAGKWLKEKVVEPIKNGYEAIKKKFTDFLDAGKKIINNIVDGIKKVGGNIINKVKEYINKAIDWIKGLPEQLKQSGINFIQGFIDGITSIGDSVKKKIEEIGGNIVDWFNHVIGNGSPSKKAKKSAKFYFQGFINGSKEMINDVTSAVSNVGDAVNKTLSAVGTTELPTITPSIVPVIDANKALIDSKYLDTISQNLDLAFNGLTFAPPILEFESDSTKILNVNNQDVVNAILDMQTRLDNLTTALMETNIYMDKDALVGQIAAPLNRTFGNMVGSRKRGKL